MTPNQFDAIMAELKAIRYKQDEFEKNVISALEKKIDNLEIVRTLKELFLQISMLRDEKDA